MGPDPYDSAQFTHAEGQAAARLPARMRVYASLVLIGCVAILGLAAWLTPDERGYGTHQRLGFGKCAMLVTTGLPCPTCGMTTAFAYTVRGRLIRAFMAQPAGLVLALATVGCALGAFWVVVKGQLPPLDLPTVTPYRLFFGLLVLLVGGWAFKIVIGLATGALPESG